MSDPDATDVINVTEKEIEEFKQNSVWLEMLKTWGLRRIGYLEDLSKADSIEDVRKIQGSIVEIDYTVQQPDFILAEIQDESEDDESTSGGESDKTE